MLVDLGHLEDLFECTWWVLINCQWSNQMLQTFVFWCCAFITLIVNQGLTLPQDPAVIGPDPLGMFGMLILSLIGVVQTSISFFSSILLQLEPLQFAVALAVTSRWLCRLREEEEQRNDRIRKLDLAIEAAWRCANSQCVHKFGHKSDVWRCTYFLRIQPSLPLLAWARQAVTPKLQHEHWRGDLIILIHSWKSK